MSKLDINEIRKITKERQNNQAKEVIENMERRIKFSAEAGGSFIYQRLSEGTLEEVTKYFEDLGFNVENNVFLIHNIKDKLVALW